MSLLSRTASWMIFALMMTKRMSSLAGKRRKRRGAGIRGTRMEVVIVIEIEMKIEIERWTRISPLILTLQ